MKTIFIKTKLLLGIAIFLISCKPDYSATCSKYNDQDVLLDVRTVSDKNLSFVEGWIDGFKASVAEQGLKSSCTEIYTE